MEQGAARSGVAIFAVGLIALVAAAVTLPDVALPWHPFSGFGMQFDGAGNVIGVEPGRLPTGPGYAAATGSTSQRCRWNRAATW